MKKIFDFTKKVNITLQKNVLLKRKLKRRNKKIDEEKDIIKKLREDLEFYENKAEEEHNKFLSEARKNRNLKIEIRKLKEEVNGK